MNENVNADSDFVTGYTASVFSNLSDEAIVQSCKQSMIDDSD